MQHVKDDMDDVFRKAAENYPLDTKSADWSKVLAALQGEVPAAIIPEKKTDKKGRLLWLLLLLPLGLICNRLYTPGYLESRSNTAAKPEKHDVPSNNVIEKKEVVTFNNPASKSRKNGGVDNKEDRIDSGNDFSEQGPSGLAERDRINPARKFSRAGREDNLSYITSNRVSENKRNNEQYKEDQMPVAFNPGEGQTSRYSSNIAVIGLNRERRSTITNRELKPLENPSDQNSKEKVPSPARQKKFYAGLIAGLDATTVKFQKIENKGYDFGVLLGYQLNKRWSIESGVYLSNKYYYTDGKYINTYKMNLPSTWRIEEASGDCKMIEVPVSVRYNFSTGKKSGWFTTLGATSYFMKEEKYTYETYYGTSGPWPHDYSYKNSSNNIFSNLSVSGGYTHRLGNFADLRLEPYLKIPISGVGIAKLPLFSTGIHIGITKKF